MRLPALRFLRLKLLHVLLQAIDPDLALGTLARQRIALPLLRELLALLRDLLALRDPLFARLRAQCTLTVSSSWLHAFAIAASRLSVSMIGVPSAA